MMLYMQISCAIVIPLTVCHWCGSLLAAVCSSVWVACWRPWPLLLYFLIVLEFSNCRHCILLLVDRVVKVFKTTDPILPVLSRLKKRILGRFKRYSHDTSQYLTFRQQNDLCSRDTLLQSWLLPLFLLYAHGIMEAFFVVRIWSVLQLLMISMMWWEIAISLYFSLYYYGFSWQFLRL